jgi:cyclopropane-fatty-acyl-phospholipid synthase
MKAAHTFWTLDRPAPSQSEALQNFFQGARQIAAETRDNWRKQRQTAHYRHPVLQAFKRATHGRITITTPEGREFHYGNGSWPRARWHIRDWSVLDIMVSHGEIGLAETYVNGQWDSEDLSSLLTYGLLNADALEKYFYGHFWFACWSALQNFFRKNSVRRSRRNILDHYDLGNDFYKLWLDSSLSYSCGLYEGKTRSLEEAQQAKYKRILDKLSLPAGSQILDIGCGWGGFAEAAAYRGLHVTGLTLSDEQKTYAQQRLNHLQPRPEIRLQDYRKVKGKFDGIASIGMFEHVGMDYWPDYFQAVRNRLKPGRKAMIQTIILDDKVFRRTRGKFGFVEQVIFPGGALPSREAFVSSVEDHHGLACMSVYAFGEDYVRTLSEWLARFDARVDDVKKLGYDAAFIRLWRFYLASCIASFTSRRCSVMQAELVRL